MEHPLGIGARGEGYEIIMGPEDGGYEPLEERPVDEEVRSDRRHRHRHHDGVDRKREDRNHQHRHHRSSSNNDKEESSSASTSTSTSASSSHSRQKTSSRSRQDGSRGERVNGEGDDRDGERHRRHHRHHHHRHHRKEKKKAPSKINLYATAGTAEAFLQSNQPRTRRNYSGYVPTLADMCVDVLSAHLDCVETLQGVPIDLKQQMLRQLLANHRVFGRGATSLGDEASLPLNPVLATETIENQEQRFEALMKLGESGLTDDEFVKLVDVFCEVRTPLVVTEPSPPSSPNFERRRKLYTDEEEKDRARAAADDEYIARRRTQWLGNDDDDDEDEVDPGQDRITDDVP